MVYMRKNSYSALHVVCGGITNVEMQNGNFIINVQDEHAYQFLTESSNYNLLKRAFVWQDLNLEIVVNLQKSDSSPADKDVKVLKQLVGDMLRVED